MDMNQKTTPAPSGTGCQLFTGFFASLALIVLGVLLGEALLTGMAGFLIIADPLESSDAVIVLSGGQLDRLQEAARIYHDQFARMLILTETGEQLRGYDQPYNFYMQLEALNLDIPSGAILLTEEHAADTFEEARAVLELMQREGMRSGVVVTDPYHTRRTRLIFQDIFQGTDIRIYVRPVRDSWYRSATWWMSAQGWEITLQEYTKLFAYFSGLMK
jgi:uncharacterized SAM-binding protein YcdF (DUF218 family)